MCVVGRERNWQQNHSRDSHTLNRKDLELAFNGSPFPVENSTQGLQLGIDSQCWQSSKAQQPFITGPLYSVCLLSLQACDVWDMALIGLRFNPKALAEWFPLSLTPPPRGLQSLAWLCCYTSHILFGKQVTSSLLGGTPQGCKTELYICQSFTPLYAPWSACTVNRQSLNLNEPRHKTNSPILTKFPCSDVVTPGKYAWTAYQYCHPLFGKKQWLLLLEISSNFNEQFSRHPHLPFLKGEKWLNESQDRVK